MRRLTLLAALAAAALAVAAPAFASEPYWTQATDLSLQGDRLQASNGGWSSNSGPVTKILYRFLRDDVVVKGLAGDVPKNSSPDSSLPGVMPDDPNANVYILTSADSGHCFVAELWGGTRSTYVLADGTVAYDVWEWGHLNSFGVPAVTNKICIGGGPPPPPPPLPPPPPVQLVIAPQVLAGARANAPYSAQLSVVGGAAPYTYSVLDGALPKGVSLAGTGQLAGSPDAPAGEYRFKVGAADKNGVRASLELVLIVLPPRLRFDTETLASGRKGRMVRTQIDVSGGSEPYVFKVVSGALPRGVVLGSDGTLRGRARRAGNFGFTVEVTDANGVQRRHYFSLRVRQS